MRFTKERATVSQSADNARLQAIETDRSEVRWRAFRRLAVWVPLCVGLIIAVITDASYRNAVESAKRGLLDEQNQRNQMVAQRIEDHFKRLHDQLSLVAKTPSLRSLAGSGAHVNDSLRETVRELFEHLNRTGLVTRLHIVPVDFAPTLADARAPNRMPIATFDTEQARVLSSPTAVTHSEADTSAPLFNQEFSVIHEQLSWFARHACHLNGLSSESIPALCGREFVTMGGPHFDPSRTHADTGIAYSVPYYGVDGNLAGCISAILRSDDLKKLLPDGNAALVCLRHNLAVEAVRPDQTQRSRDAVRLGEPDAGLICSSVKSIRVPDAQAEWRLWTGVPDDQFWNRSTVQTARRLAIFGYVGAAMAGIGLGLLGRLAIRNHDLVRTRASELEHRVLERTGELSRAMAEAENASRIKSLFLANMSHEIRTPMTAILGFADLLLDPELDASERASTIHTIRRNGQHLLVLIEDILDLAKIEAGRLTVEPVACPPILECEETLSLLMPRAREKHIELRPEYCYPLPAHITADPLRLRQVLLNLVGNAVKFTDHGEVRLRVSVPDKNDAKARIRFEVIDTGIGMDEPQLGRIFRPFFQADDSMSRRFGGTGLGLSVSKSLVEMMGGSIRAISRAGQGSTFIVELPLPAPELRQWITDGATPPSPDEPAGVAPLQQTLLGRRILLAEDGPDNQRLILYHLRRAGATVVACATGFEAADTALNAQSSGQPFDVVLMDMQMPDLDGYGASSLLRERGYQRPIVALTAHAMTGDRERCLRAGCDDYLNKPINRDRLVETCALWARTGKSKPHDARAAHDRAA